MPIQVKDLANIPEEEKLEKERLELIEKANEFRKGIINTLKSNDKIENREGNDTSFYIYYNYKKKEIVTEDEMYDEIERRFSGIEQFPFYSLIIDNDRKPPYAVIHFSIYEDYLSITCEYLEKIIKDGYGTTFHGEGRGDSFFGNCRLVFKREVDYGKYNDRIIFFKTGHEDEFRRVVQWYHKNRASVMESLEEEDFAFKYKYLYYFYIQDRCNVNTFFEYYRDELHTTLEDIFMMASTLRYKVEIKAKSWNGFNNYHDYLVLKLNKQKARRSKKKYKLKTYWVRIDEALKQSKLKTKRLDSAEALSLEGTAMHHCVGGYTYDVDSGTSYIFHVDYKGKPYTCELRYKDSNRVKKFYIRQLYGKYNRTAPDALRKEIRELISE